MALALELLPFSSFVVFLEVGRSIFQNSSKCLWLPRCWGSWTNFHFQFHLVTGFTKPCFIGCTDHYVGVVASYWIFVCMYMFTLLDRVMLLGLAMMASDSRSNLNIAGQLYCIALQCRCEKYRDLIKAVISMFFLLLSSFPNSFWVRKSAFESQKGRCSSVIPVNDG